MQWCEDTLLAVHCEAERQASTISIEDHPVLDALSAAQIEGFSAELETRTYARGEKIRPPR